MEKPTQLAHLRDLLQTVVLKAELVDEVQVFARDGLWVLVLPTAVAESAAQSGRGPND